MDSLTTTPDPEQAARPRQRKGEAGFSLVESLTAVSLLAIGLLSLAAVFTKSVQRMSNLTWDVLAKEKAAEAIENILAARDEGRLAWEEMNNTGEEDGIFVKGPQALVSPGPDRLPNTADDDEETPTNLRRPGPDGQLLTDDDEVIDLAVFKREIVIAPVGGGGTLREVRVIITHNAGGVQRTIQMRSYVSSFSG
jgi:type II secretory pathway pseudopilin PulG